MIQKKVVATFVSIGIWYRLVSVNIEHKTITVKVWMEENEAVIINYYKLCKRITGDILNTIGV